MHNYLCVDFAGVVLTHIFTCDPKDAEDINFLRNLVIRAMTNLKKYIDPSAKLIICMEGKSWRKEFNPYYKANRKEKKSKYNWNIIYPILNSIVGEMQEYLNWEFIRHPNAEGDDAIAVISKLLSYKGNSVTIVSRDKDFIQLIDENIRMYDPCKKAYVNLNPKEVEDYLVKHIIKGDGGDGIPNILSDADTFVTNKRQTVMSKKKYEKYSSMSHTELLADDEVSARYQENDTQINLKRIPTQIVTDIIKMYEENSKIRHEPFLYLSKYKIISNHMNNINYF
jgi:hypothetical protein